MNVYIIFLYYMASSSYFILQTLVIRTKYTTRQTAVSMEKLEGNEKMRNFWKNENPQKRKRL